MYEYNVYLINFWRWWDETKEHRIKGMNKEKALTEFVAAIRDKAKTKDLSTVFVPPPVGAAFGDSGRRAKSRFPKKSGPRPPGPGRSGAISTGSKFIGAINPAFPSDPAHLSEKRATRSFGIKPPGPEKDLLLPGPGGQREKCRRPAFAGASDSARKGDVMPFHRFAAAVAGSLVFAVSALPGQELPKPSIYNTVIVSIEHNPADADEVEYIKANFPFGLYALLSFSITHVAPNLAWDSDWSQAEAGIAAFKAAVDGHIAAAKARGVKLHLVVCSGLARNLGIYAAAKTEDIRNAQWFNDRNLGTAAQVAAPSAMTDHIFGTLSRYARKLRANLEAKSQAAFAFLKQRMNENPDTLIAVSGWGEAELSWKRIDNLASVQDWFCDYSPFAVLEFRDWITHEGLYDDERQLWRLGLGVAAERNTAARPASLNSTPISGRRLRPGSSNISIGA